MFMRGLRKTALTKSVWQAAGYALASDQKKRTAIQHLRKIPQVFSLIEKRSPTARYWIVYGPLWKQSPHVFIEEEDT
jgi:hypothetical protein